ncbi:hypothetical protein FPV67DRAFT_1679973 [Lyophyllum atratum]|nr:hypothetical protein FPV67DRAFT_1679973 [Lyophyllum atratum]
MGRKPDPTGLRKPTANKKKSDKSTRQDTGGKCFSCGCREDDALLGFIIWKTWSVSEVIKGAVVTEGFSKEEILTPRDRLFIIQALRDRFGLTLDDFYHGSLKADEVKFSRKLIKKSVNFLIDKYNKLEEGEEEEKVTVAW